MPSTILPVTVKNRLRSYISTLPFLCRPSGSLPSHEYMQAPAGRAYLGVALQPVQYDPGLIIDGAGIRVDAVVEIDPGKLIAFRKHEPHTGRPCRRLYESASSNVAQVPGSFVLAGLPDIGSTGILMVFPFLPIVPDQATALGKAGEIVWRVLLYQFMVG